MVELKLPYLDRPQRLEELVKVEIGRPLALRAVPEPGAVAPTPEVCAAEG